MASMDSSASPSRVSMARQMRRRWPSCTALGGSVASACSWSGLPARGVRQVTSMSVSVASTDSRSSCASVSICSASEAAIAMHMAPTPPVPPMCLASGGHERSRRSRKLEDSSRASSRRPSPGNCSCQSRSDSSSSAEPALSGNAASSTTASALPCSKAHSSRPGPRSRLATARSVSGEVASVMNTDPSGELRSARWVAGGVGASPWMSALDSASLSAACRKASGNAWVEKRLGSSCIRGEL